jgi:hypothetical protein
VVAGSTPRLVPAGNVQLVDEGLPESWEVLEPGTAVFASDGSRVGEVKKVLAEPEEDIFEGLLIETPAGERFVGGDQVGSIHERGVDLKLDSAAAATLPEPTPAPATMEVGVDEVSEASGPYKREAWLKRAWNRITGNY